MFLYQTNRSFTNFRGKLCLIAHGSILSKVGASSKPGAIQYFFWILIGVNIIAVICTALRMIYIELAFWPTDVFVAIAASILSWMQAKRFSELAASYTLASHEIGLIKEQSLLPDTHEKFSLFVGDAENAFSREHTQWVARKDV